MRFRNSPERFKTLASKLCRLCNTSRKLIPEALTKSRSLLLWFLRLGSYFTPFIREWKKYSSFQKSNGKFQLQNSTFWTKSFSHRTYIMWSWNSHLVSQLAGYGNTKATSLKQSKENYNIQDKMSWRSIIDWFSGLVKNYRFWRISFFEDRQFRCDKQQDDTE